MSVLKPGELVSLRIRSLPSGTAAHDLAPAWTGVIVEADAAAIRFLPKVEIAVGGQATQSEEGEEMIIPWDRIAFVTVARSGPNGSGAEVVI